MSANTPNRSSLRKSWLDITAVTAWGLLLLKYAIDGTLYILVHPSYYLLITVTGGCLLLIGILQSWRLDRGKIANSQELHLSLLPQGVATMLLLGTAVAGLIITPKLFTRNRFEILGEIFCTHIPYPVNTSKALQPLDRIAMILMAGLAIITLILLWSGDHTLPQVRDFNWQNRSISAEDTAFTLTFNRPVDRATVEKQLQIAPPLPGKISWAGSKLAYTLSNPAPYGNTYKIGLQGAKEAIGNKSGKEIVPFQGQFQTPDRMFAYISSGEADRGRIVIYNFKTHKSTTISPVGLVVTDFKVDRYSQTIVFTATDIQTLQNRQPAIASQQIYSVSTGIVPRNSDTQFTPPGKLELILDNRDYQNVKFDLAPDGKKIVVQRVSRKNPSDFALWVVALDKSTPPIKLKQSGDFVITPDSSEVAAAVGEGISIFPLVPINGSNLDFLPRFGNVLSFTTDGTAAAMVEYNSDYTKSLFVVNNQGIEQQVFKTNGSIWDAKFSPAKDLMYCLATELKTKGNNSYEEPYLAAIDLKTDKIVMMILLPIQQGLQMSLSPDGLAVMFDQIDGAESTNQIIQGGRNGILWLLPIPPNLRELSTAVKAERLSLSGWHPRWLT